MCSGDSQCQGGQSGRSLREAPSPAGEQHPRCLQSERPSLGTLLPGGSQHGPAPLGSTTAVVPIGVPEMTFSPLHEVLPELCWGDPLTWW